MPRYSLTEPQAWLQTACLVTKRFLHFKMPVFVFKALKGAVMNRPLSLHSSQCSLCHQWSRYSFLCLKTPIRIAVTPYLASQNEMLSLQEVPHIDPFKWNNFPSLLPLFAFFQKIPFISSHSFLPVFSLHTWLFLKNIVSALRSWSCPF